MKHNQNIFLLLVASLLFIVSCTQEETFSADPTLADFESPSDLSYQELVNGRENAAVKTGPPNINTGGLTPLYEIVSARKSDGTILDETYMNDASIANPEEKEVNLKPEDYYVVDGDTIKTYTGVNTSKGGVITITDENQFGIDDYYFTVKVTTSIENVPHTTTFEDVFHLGVGPGLVTNLLYSPLAQNIVVGSGDTTTQPYLITGNPDVTFELTSHIDTLLINSETGVIRLQDTYTVTQNDTIYPIVEVTSNISQETTEFQGESFLTLVASNSPVDLPKQTNYFFYPTLQSENKLYGYAKTVINPGSVTDAKTWLQANPANLAAAERPDNITGNKSLWTNMTAGTYMAHESYVTINPQDLTQYSLGYDLTMVFYTKNQYVEYMPSGETPSDLEIYISEDYTGEDNTSTWTKVNDQLSTQINSLTVTPFIGFPYPGDQKLKSGMTNHGQDTSKNADAKWVRSEMNLNDYKDVKNFTLKFKIISNYTDEEYPGGIKGVGGSRPGRYYISDIHFKASEE